MQNWRGIPRKLATISKLQASYKQVISKLVASEDTISRQAVIEELPRRTMRNYFGEVVGDVVYIDDIKALPPVTPQQKTGWIPVSETPKKLGTYLIQTDGEYMCECRWTDVNPYWTDKKTKPHWNIFDIPQYSKVVAWMPKPAPYKAESGEQA